MAFRGPTDLVHWLAGFDLAGQGALIEVNPSVVAVMKDVTPLGRLGKIQHEVPLGRIEYSLSETGYLRDRQSSLRRLFAASVPATPWRSIFGQQGDAIGDPVTLATDLRLRQDSRIPDKDDISKAAVDYFNSRDGLLYQRAVLLAHGVVENVVDVGLQPAAAYRHDNGASSNTGAVICLMVDVDASRWRGYPNLKLQMRHSVNPASSYANLGAAWDLERDDDGQTLITVASGTVINRYLAVRFTFSGTRDTGRMDGAHLAGATDISVDGFNFSNTERIEVGDILEIGGNDYGVGAAEYQGTNDWNVVLTSGLAANVADNGVVDLTGTHTRLRYAACIERT